MPKIKIPSPQWESSLTGIILDLEKLRSRRLYGEVPPYIFFQLKEIFQKLETLGSARIEGNNTTLSEYIEKLIEDSDGEDESRKEIGNLERAIKWIEVNTEIDTVFTAEYITTLHLIVTDGLTREWSRQPGQLRNHDVMIQKSKHVPPKAAFLKYHFDEFLEFINYDFPEQYQLLMIAIAHHRFAYVHPFDNGNGRMGRLLNYALLIKLWFKVKNGRIVNPSAVFYSDRENYYEHLSIADSLADVDILTWSEYFLSGLKSEIEKIDRLLEIDYVRDKILKPALNRALERQLITEMEFRVLDYVIDKEDMSMKAAELDIFWMTNSLQKSRFMSKLKVNKMVCPIKEDGRIYTISFANNYLLRGVIRSLEDNGFVSGTLEEN